MADSRKCIECQTTNSIKFRSLGGKKWKEIKSKGLEKESWKEGNVMCNTCYMRCVENPLRRKRKANDERETNEKEEEMNTTSINFDFTEAVKSMARILYKRECI